MKDQTILFIMPRLPFPASSGRKTSLFHYCRILSEDLGYRLVVAAFLENGDNLDLKPKFIDKLVVLPKTSGKSKITNMLKDSLILKRKPMQVSLYWNKKAKKEIDLLIENEKPFVVIADMIRTTEYIKDCNVYRVVDFDDRISLRYSRQAKIGLSEINPYGAYIETLPKLLQKIVLCKPIKNYVVKNEIKLLKKYEIEIGRNCDKAVFVAQNEADQFNKDLGEDKSVAIPTGVDVDYFKYHKPAENNYIAFLGAMNVAHNEDAVKHFIMDILPLIKNKIPDVKLLVIGGSVSDSLISLQNKNIEFTGYVEDVREYLKKCKLFVCPMRFGSGIKTKNLEAMSFGLPVVTTSIGAENINAENGKDWLIEDDNEKFAEAVVYLLNNNSASIKIGYNGSNFVKNNFSWDIAKEKFIELFKLIKT